MDRMKVATIGSDNIGTDLMIKVMRSSQHLQMGALVGIDTASDGLARAARLRVPTTADGVDGLLAIPDFESIGMVFDATSAKAHVANAAKLAPFGKQLIDLTPAAIGPSCRRSISTRTSPRRTSKWRPAADRPRSRSSPRSPR